MSKYGSISLKPYGVMVDADPFDVPMEAWTSARNMRFKNAAMVKMGGEKEAIATTQQPYYLLFNGDHSSPSWFYMGNGTIRKTDFVTDDDLDTGGNVNLGTVWDATLFNNIPVMNNEVQTPWTWLGTGDVSPLPNFPASTTCKAISPYKSFLIALNITEGTTQQPTRLIWSDASDEGALPPSWDITDPSTLAGDAWLTSSKGDIIDGLQLRDYFIIYKTHATYIMRLVSGQSVMKIDKVQINSGLLAKNCVQEFGGMHFVVADGDVVLFDGQSIKSIADKRVRGNIFLQMDDIFYRNSYVVRYDRMDEMWLCYPTVGNEWPNRAAIWNWKEDTWTFRDLTEARHIASGLALIGSFPYTEANFTYDSDEAKIPYAPLSDTPTTDTLITATDGKLGIIDDTLDIYGVPMGSELEKLSMDLGTDDIKMIKSVVPRITAAPGTRIHITVGSQFRPDDMIDWCTEVIYTVGVDREAHVTKKGRFISIRLRSQDANLRWKLHSVDIKMAKSGKH